MAQNGTLFLILVNTGTVMSPTYEIVGSQRDASLEETSDTIDVSSKDQREMRVLPGRYSANISFDALYVEDDSAYLALQDANRNGTLILVGKQNDNFTFETATAKVDSISSEFPDQSEATISVTLTIDGAWNVVSS